MSKAAVSLRKLISMGINEETKTVSKKFLEVMSRRAGYTLGMAEAVAKDLGAEIVDDDPTNFSYIEAVLQKRLTFEQDTILVDKVQHPEIHGEGASDLSMEVLCRVYGKDAKYAVVKCGLRGTLVNNDGHASSSCCEDAEGEALADMVSTIRKYDPAYGFKLITMIDRRANFHLKDCIRDGVFVDNHKMGRREQAIVKYLTKNPENRKNYKLIASETGVPVSFVEEFIRKTNGKSVTDQSLENLMEGAEKQAHGKEDSNVVTDFVEEDWLIAANNTENEALRNTMFRTLKYISNNALTDDEKQLIFRTVVGNEKKSAVAKELKMGTNKANAIIEEGLGKIKLYMELNHYDADTVYGLLSA